MSTPAPHGATNRAAGRDTTAAAMAELCSQYTEKTGRRVSARTARKAVAVAIHPDVAQHAAYLEITDPAHIAYLQRLYDNGQWDRAAAEDWTPTLVVSGPHGSHTADPQGDRIAAKITRERDAA